jgi:AcrR family transcriptional regulator
MVRPRKTEQIDLPQAIKMSAWKLIATEGAAALSLRAIARELGITAPAIYNYFSDRDALVTELIVDAFTSFGDAQHAAVEAVAPGAHGERLLALGLAYREWAVQFPERFQLIFGTPIAGYTAPAHLTSPAAARGLEVLVGVLAAAHAQGRLRTTHLPPMSAELQAMFALWQQDRGGSDSEVFYLALTVWAAVQGLVALEVGHQFPPYITAAGPLYRRAVAVLVAQTIDP